MSTADRDDLAAILAKHRLFGTENDDFAEHECGCGLSPDADDELRYEDFGELIWHEAHVADVVGDWSRGVKAQAWDECCQAMAWAFENNSTETSRINAIKYVADNNPYRADRVDAEDTDNTTDRT